MSLQTLVIVLSAGFFACYGLAFSLSPAAMSLLVTGAEPTGASALVDFRATYGGMSLAVGITVYYLHAIRQSHAALVVTIMVLMCMAATRTVGLMVEGSGNVLMYVYLALELLGSALAYIAMKQGAEGV